MRGFALFLPAVWVLKPREEGASRGHAVSSPSTAAWGAAGTRLPAGAKTKVRKQRTKGSGPCLSSSLECPSSVHIQPPDSSWPASQGMKEPHSSRSPFCAGFRVTRVLQSSLSHLWGATGSTTADSRPLPQPCCTPHFPSPSPYSRASS